MNYLPSQKFIKRTLSLVLLTAGWLYFSGGETQKINVEKVGEIVDSGGTMVFSKNTDNETTSGSSNSTNQSANGVLKNNTNATIANISTAFKKIELSEILRSDADTTEAIQNYGKGLASVLEPYSKSGLSNEALLTLGALESKDGFELINVLSMGQLHKAIAENLKTMIVPQEFAMRHLNLLNNINKLSYLDFVMADAFENPKAAVEAVVDFKSETKDFMNSVVDINDLFKEKGVVFGKDEKIKIYINNVE